MVREVASDHSKSPARSKIHRRREATGNTGLRGILSDLDHRLNVSVHYKITCLTEGPFFAEWTFEVDPAVAIIRIAGAR